MLDYDVIDSFKKKKKSQIIAAIFAIPILALKVFKTEVSQLEFLSDNLVIAILAVYVIGLLVFSFINWRCPKCNAYLGKEIGIKHCKSCGIQLVEHSL